MNILSRILSATMLGMITLPMLSMAEVGRGEILDFEVLLDDKRIGNHRFHIRPQADGQVVTTSAEFDVSFLLVPVYRYRHDNSEVWRDGCLAGIASETDANGERYVVNGKREDQGFRIATSDSTRRYDQQCLMSFAYWNRDVLQQSRLLNPQTGELHEVQVEFLGTARFDFGGGEVRAEGYRISAHDGAVDLKVWYSQNGNRWLALESALENGRILRYIPMGDRAVSAANGRATQASRGG